MPRYRKKPVEIEAMQWDGSVTSASEVIDWILSCDGTARYHQERYVDLGVRTPDEINSTRRTRYEPAHIAIDTLEGTMKARSSWYVIKGVRGEFYACEPEIFRETYDAVVARIKPSRCKHLHTHETCIDCGTEIAQ